MLNANINTTTDSASTSVALNTIQSYVDRYRAFGKTTATNIVEMASTFKEAKQQLSAMNFDTFCVEINIDRKGSTFRKLVAIGEQSELMLNHVDKLPCDWTTLYFLATVAKQSSQLFEAVLSSANYKLGVSLKTIKTIAFEAGYVDKKKKAKKGSLEVDGAAGKKEAKAKRSMSIMLDDLPEDQARQVYSDIETLRERYKFKTNATTEYMKLGEPHNVDTVH